MASYNVRLYQNTGFNGVNTPENPALLNKCTFIDVAPVNILQDRGLDHVDVSATWDQVENVDYVRVGSWYYSVPPRGASMLSERTVRLTLLSDPLASAGGFTMISGGVSARFDFLDGITQRCTTNSDNWGEYANDDPLIIPQEPLQIESEWLNTGDTADKENIKGAPIFRESTVDLSHQGAGPDNCVSITYTDDETGSVSVPTTVGLPYITGVGRQQTDFVLDGNVSKSNGDAIFIVNDEYTSDDTDASASKTIENGTNAIRSLGQENGSIINQWTVPNKFLGDIKVHHGPITGNDNVNYGTEQVVSSIAGITGTTDSTISPDYKAVKNKRLLYGTYNKYGMITCSGDSVEFKPEDLGDEKAPEVVYKSDPRPDGKPFYRFAEINGDKEFWRNCIAGSTWERVPLVYQGASGSALTRLNFDNDRALRSLQKSQFETSAKWGGVQDVAHAFAGTMEGAAMGAVAGPGGMVAGALAGGVLSSVPVANDIISYDQYQDKYRQEKANELSGLYQSTTVYAPTVNFPYNADMLRDIKNNGVLIYKYHMSDRDTERCDKLLTMYGYQTAEQLTLENFGRREHFDYVACSTVSVTNLPKWWCDEIASVLKVGVRVWHELPNSKAYEDNPIRRN